MKKVLMVLSVLFGAGSYLYIIMMVISTGGNGFSFSTFALWSALAWITSYTMVKQGADALVPMIYGCGATTTTLVLIWKGRFGWTQFDTVIALLVLLCIILLLTSGPRWALIMSVTAGAIAGLPFVLMTWQAPAQSPVISNSGFLAANVLALIAAKAWTMEDRLYAVVNVVVCTLLVIPWFMG